MELDRRENVDPKIETAIEANLSPEIVYKKTTEETIWVLMTFLIYKLSSVYYYLPLSFIGQGNGTLMKKNRTKVKHTNRPPGVPYNNKKMPLDCHVCRVVTEEIENIIKDDKKQLDPEGEKNRKRENRRKKKDSSTQKTE
uniref:uncharacterized protein LOC120341784 n=1 Tax=Styela clava TaxID=7725 RepID=UPI001939D9A1|nr:uncharacterized protein LOC120341784 [Styela clava]